MAETDRAEGVVGELGVTDSQFPMEVGIAAICTAPPEAVTLMVWEDGMTPPGALNVRLVWSATSVVPACVMVKLVASVALDCTVMTPLRVALEGLGAKTAPVEPVVLVELVPWRVSHVAVVVMNDGQEFDPPELLLQEMVVDPPPAGKLVPLLELMVKRLLLQVLCACRLPSNITVAARQEKI